MSGLAARLTGALLALALAGCGEDTTPEACDSSCRVETAVSAWARSDEEGAAAMLGLADPTERMLVARSVIESGHVEGGAVCAFVDSASTRRYCMRLSGRPHLFERPRPKANRRVRAAGGPVDSELLPAGPSGSLAAATVATELAQCENGEDVTACADRAAMQAARQGRIARIAGLCNAIKAPKLRSECRFAAADEAVKMAGAGAVRHAVPLCLAAGEFVAHCLAHTVTRLAERAPAANAAPAAWAGVIAGSAALGAALLPHDAALAASASGRVYAEATAFAYARASAIDGAPLAALPVSAAPAVRASLAWELVKRGELQSVTDLEAAVAGLALAEALRIPNAARLLDPARVVARNRWEADDRQSRAFAATWWGRGTARRPTSADADIDRALCVLEAVADIRGQGAGMLTAAIQHPERIIAWSGARLSGKPGALPPAASAPR